MTREELQAFQQQILQQISDQVAEADRRMLAMREEAEARVADMLRDALAKLRLGPLLPPEPEPTPNPTPGASPPEQPPSA